MKIYGLPKELPAPTPDYLDYDSAKIQADEDAHRDALKAHMIGSGYTGKRTGEIYRTPIADGYAEYMLADGAGGGLVHLPYGDGYQCPNVQHLPKRVIIERIDADKRIMALFAK